MVYNRYTVVFISLLRAYFFDNMYPNISENFHNGRFFLLIIESLIDAVKLIGIVYLVLFCNHLERALTDMTFQSSTFVKIKSSWINWIWSNNTGVNPDAILNTVRCLCDSSLMCLMAFCFSRYFENYLRY